MLNQVVLVGRIVVDPEITKTENNKKMTILTVAVPRAYKNMADICIENLCKSFGDKKDFIKCVLWAGIAETTCEYCKKGDIVGIKGRIQVNSYEKDNEKKYSMEVVAEKVSFLSSKKAD